MAGLHHRGCWDETQCLNYYGLMSLHDVFEVVGSQLTETDVEVLSFLLNETYSASHPLDPAGWTVEPPEDDPDDKGVPPSPALFKVWRRLHPQGSQRPTVECKPKSGLELLLELERRGYLSDGNLEPLLQLLRVLTRHDLLPLVSHKKRRTVSPGRTAKDSRESMQTAGMGHNFRQTEVPLPSFTQLFRRGVYPDMAGPPPRGRRKKRGYGWSRRPRKSSREGQQLLLLSAPYKASCDVRLRVRAEYLEHESALRESVSSDKRQPLERQFELFSQANLLLSSRNLGSIVCNIKFTELDNLEAFWGDYLSGALLEALKGVFITDSLRRAAGTEAVRLLISVDQDDYEEGQRLLSARKTLSSSHGGRTDSLGFIV